ncbi:putative zinc finger CCHC domain-containing protein 3-like [Apostichopus japonicus]|uniref:Putative zinc finger CCHC domain-containing protein 3-like n=1 Tax=Stichopus japonicus TaxID=307972 RepID=A0A2G8JP09_STIJA|nr:putative zinc finger CCHC domain-containing protein 3-like [Apostichopus japonicus]
MGKVPDPNSTISTHLLNRIQINILVVRVEPDMTRQKGVTLLSGVEGLTVTHTERSYGVTVIHVGLEVRQELVATVLGRFGAVEAIKMCSYAQAPGVLNVHRQVRIDLKQDIPSFLFIAGHKAHVRHPGQPRTCFRCGETGHEAKGCPNKKCGRCLRLGHDTSACPSEVVCSLCGKEGHVFRAFPSSYVFMTKRGNRVRIHLPQLVQPPLVADPTVSTTSEADTPSSSVPVAAGIARS